jgi:hypothetical protein
MEQALLHRELFGKSFVEMHRRTGRARVDCHLDEAPA